MITVNIHEAKTHLSKLIDQAVKGEPFVIAKAGKPVVKVIAFDAPSKPRRLGFLAGQIAIPEDFDRMGEAEIMSLFRNAGRTHKLDPPLALTAAGDSELAELWDNEKDAEYDRL